MILGFTYGKFPEVENRRRQHRGRMPLADAIHQVIEMPHPAGGDHRHRDAIRHGLGQRNVKTLPGSVPVHGRQQDFTGPERDHLLGIFDRVDARGITTAMGKDFPALAAAATLDALGVDRDHDALVAEFFRGLLDEFAAADSGAVDRHLVAAGSPASRRSTKLTPLTTRPSLTSRQGITRTLNMQNSSIMIRSD